MVFTKIFDKNFHLYLKSAFVEGYFWAGLHCIFVLTFLFGHKRLQMNKIEKIDSGASLNESVVQTLDQFFSKFLSLPPRNFSVPLVRFSSHRVEA